MRSIILYILFTVLICGCQQSKTTSEVDNFHGLWSLYIMEQHDSISNEWKEWRNGMQGYLLYEETGYMSLHLLNKDYQNTDLEFPNFTDTISLEALKHLTKSYVYFAKYSIDTNKNIVEHARISHSNPAEWNKIVKRKYQFKGDTLILTPAEQKNSSLRLKWIRLKND